MNLDRSQALVTGGGTGIGRAVALALAREGCRVALTGRREEKLRETAALWSGNPAMLFFAADVSERPEVVKLFAWAERELGQIDILIQSAGINIPRRSLAELDPSDWDRVLMINATGAFNCMRAVLPQMRRRREGLIVNISSVAGKRASVLAGAAYSAAKFAMTALGTCAGMEEAENGIRVTNVYPGEVDSPILDERPVPVTPEHRARILQPEDVAQAVVMIAKLPPRAHIPDLVIKPVRQPYS